MECHALKILMLTCQYMPDVYGGAEKQCKRLSSVLQSAGADVHILTSTQTRHLESIDDDGLNVTRIYTKVAPDLLGRWSAFSVYWLVRVLIWGWRNRSHYDVIHCHQGKFGAFVGCALGKLVGKRVLIKIGNSESDMDLLCLRRKALWGPLAYRFVLAQQPLMIAISSVIERNLRDAGFTNVQKIPNGIDRKIAVSYDQTGNHDCINLFYHGRVEPIKQLDLLVKAYGQIKADNLRLHIYGDGTELKRIQALAESLPNGDSIIFHGAQDDVISYITQNDIFVNSSRSEGFSNSLLEALLLEKIMVSTDVSGAAEAIEDGVNGAIARAATAESLAEAIERALYIFEHQREQAQQECQRKLNHVFDMELVSQKYLKIYEGL